MFNYSFNLKLVRGKKKSAVNIFLPSSNFLQKLYQPQVFGSATVKQTVCGPYLSYFVSLAA